MVSNPRNRIRELRERAGLSQEELARRLNTSQPQVFRLEKAQRGLTQAWMVRLAKALRVELWELVQDRPLPADEPEPSMTSIPVRGHVQAGDWREAIEWPRGDWYAVFAPADRRWPRAQRFALEVRGPSMNRLYPDGSVILCVLFDELGREPRSGERVVVERVNRAGQFETTVKEFVVEGDGRRWLWPRSDHPDHQQPIPLDNAPRTTARRRIKFRKATVAHADARRDDGIESMRIYAKVVGSYRPE